MSLDHHAPAHSAASGAEDRAPHDVDVHVGRRIRGRRKALGITQQQLADRLKLTFQQVQKYERGANRVSASKLFLIARTLNAPINYFFEGLGDTGQPDPDAAIADRMMAEPGGQDLADAYLRLTPAFRRSLLTIASALLATGCEGEA